MPHSFALSADYPVGVDAVFAAFTDRRYWLARLADSGADTATLDALTVDGDGAVEVTATQRLHRDRLPGLAVQFLRGDLEVVRRELWHPVRDGTSRGSVDAAVTAVPAALSSNTALVPIAAGSRLTVSAAVRVKVPLLGGRIEGLIAGALGDLLVAEQRFTETWLTEHG